jgi:hypothetical protein
MKNELLSNMVRFKRTIIPISAIFGTIEYIIVTIVGAPS